MLRLAPELLIQNRAGNPSASRPLLAPSKHGWYTPGKEGSDGARAAAPESQELRRKATCPCAVLGA